MANIILNGAVVPNTWTLIESVEPLAAADVAEGSILPLSVWLAVRETLLENPALAGKRVGVWLAPSDEPGELVDDIAGLPLIAVQFPAFTDGRGYSIGRLLRERYGYKGEMRAIGDVGRDHLFNLFHCGFNAFEIKASQTPEHALEGLKAFSDGYQSSEQRKLPAYRRRPHAQTADSWAEISSPS
ncbi:MAG: Oxidoreductase [Betaproteobacteria bacterium]|nr:Oxidoreductase [Betaproteobacteria bacterium]